MCRTRYNKKSRRGSKKWGKEATDLPLSCMRSHAFYFHTVLHTEFIDLFFYFPLRNRILLHKNIFLLLDHKGANVRRCLSVSKQKLTKNFAAKSTYHWVRDSRRPEALPQEAPSVPALSTPITFNLRSRWGSAGHCGSSRSKQRCSVRCYPFHQGLLKRVDTVSG